MILVDNLLKEVINIKFCSTINNSLNLVKQLLKLNTLSISNIVKGYLTVNALDNLYLEHRFLCHRTNTHINLTLYLMSSQVDAIYGMAAHYLPERMAGPLMADIKRIMAARSTLWMWVTGLFSMYSFVQGLVILTRATDSLDYAHTKEMAYDAGHNLLVYAKGTIFTFGLMLVIFLSLGLPVFGNTVVYYLDETTGLPDAFLFLWNVLRILLPFAVLVVWLTFFYIFAPHSYTPPFHQAALTALVVTCLWLAVTGIYSWCMLLVPEMGIAYGSLFGLFALFVWFKFIVSFIIYGIEFLMALSEMELRRAIQEMQKPRPQNP